ncbi:MAG TPA: hypothetical protein VFI25_05090 [Planctomycetota bacterium]|nr:hypothetical protein [Planctomycetota bacterium]
MGVPRPRLLTLLLASLAGCQTANPSLHWGSLLGHQFVAEGALYTAAHLEPHAREVAPDLVVLEETRERGLRVCRRTHVEGDEVLLLCAEEFGSFRDTRGRISATGRVLAVELDREVFPGLSGAPVLCALHRRVLGALVAGHERTAVVTPIPPRNGPPGALASPAGSPRPAD